MTTPDSNQPGQDNTPLFLPEETKTDAATQPAGPGIDRTLWYTIGGILFVSCCGILLIGYLFTQTSQFKQATTFPVFDYTPRPTADVEATRAAWTQPQAQPTLGSREEAEEAIDRNVARLEMFSTYYPDMPEVNQPDDMYLFSIALDNSGPHLWAYTWCTLTEQLLDDNFAQMEVVFKLNGETVSAKHIFVKDTHPQEDYHCRSLTILVREWPAGSHMLRTSVTFQKPTDDGWDVYPAGTHYFIYYVTVSGSSR